MTSDSGAPRIGLRLKYGGPALEGGHMNATDAGVAIAAAGRLIECASEVVLGAEGQVSLEVDAHFRDGSFDIQFSAVSWVNHVLAMVHYADLKTIVGIIFGEGGVLWLYARLRGKAEKVTKNGPDVTINAGSNTYTTTTNVYNVLVSGDAAQAMRDLVSPMKKEGVDNLMCQPENVPPIVLQKDDVEAFDEPVSEETI
jgi:hypothetical protein